MKKLVYLFVLSLAFCQLNAQSFMFEKNSVKSDSTIQPKTNYDSESQTLKMYEVKKKVTIISELDTVSQSGELKLIHSKNSKEFVEKYPNAFWNFANLEENKKEELTREKVKDCNRNLKHHTEFEILYGAKIGNFLFLEVENKYFQERNGGSIFWFCIICLFILLSASFFVDKYKKFFKEKKGLMGFCMEDTWALTGYVLLGIGVGIICDPLLIYSWIISFGIGLILRLILLLRK